MADDASNKNQEELETVKSTTIEPLGGEPEKQQQQQQQQEILEHEGITKKTGSYDKLASSLIDELDKVKDEKSQLEKQISALRTKIDQAYNELEREVQRRCDMEQRFTDEAKRSTDQIEELIAKSDQDDAKLNELKKKFDLYSRETSSMIENFTTNRELLTSQLTELRRENDYLLGKYIGKSRDLQNGEINLPQTVEELQFHCLTLNEKLILATLAKEQLEETLMQNAHN